MKSVRIINETNNTILAENGRTPITRKEGFIGLMGKKNFPQSDALILMPCNCIHMLLVRFPIDVIFLDKNNKIVFILEGFKPWRISPKIDEACCVIELPAGTIVKTGTVKGAIIRLQRSP